MVDRLPFPLFSDTDKTWVDQLFDDHLLVRDLVLVAVFIVPFTVMERFWYEETWQMAILEAILITVVVLAVVEAHARWRGTSMFRYVLGGDSHS